MTHISTDRLLAELQARLTGYKELEAMVDTLKAALAADGVEWEPPMPAVMVPLTQQERALVGVLLRAYPRAVCREAILACLPSQDHAMDRNPGLISVLVHRIRAKAGAGAVISHRPWRFSLSPEFRERLIG